MVEFLVRNLKDDFKVATLAGDIKEKQKAMHWQMKILQRSGNRR